MMKILLITIGITLLIFVPIVFVASIVISDIKTQLWNEAPEEMLIVQNGISSFFDSIGNFIVGNWFYIFIVLILSLIAYLLFRILGEIIWSKNPGVIV